MSFLNSFILTYETAYTDRIVYVCFRQKVSAFTCKSFALCFFACAGILTVDVNGRGRTFTVLVVSALMSLAVNTDFFAAAGFFFTVCY